MDQDFDELYYSSYAAVLRAVLLLVPAREDAHDVVQEAFVRALQRWTTVSRLDNPGAWVRRVALNAAVDVGRRDTSRHAAYRRWSGRSVPVPPADAAGVDMSRALQMLKPAQRQAVVLHYLLDMSVAQIAEETGRPVGTIKTNLARGRAALAALLLEGHVVLDV